jgi:thiamine pyrophosphate-dependent acetolactate synthase large subunit-like protein
MSGNGYSLKRRAVVAGILADRGDDLLVVTGLGGPNWDATAAGDSPLNFPLWGAMGGALPMGLGLALARPDKRVLTVTGDGDLLMSLGCLATIGVQRPSNLAVVVLDNERYGETGRQRTATAAGVDLCAIARASGFAATAEAREEGDLAELRRLAREAEGPTFSVVKIAMEPLKIVMPPRDGAYLKDRFRVALLGEDGIV